MTQPATGRNGTTAPQTRGGDVWLQDALHPKHKGWSRWGLAVVLAILLHIAASYALSASMESARGLHTQPPPPPLEVVFEEAEEDPTPPRFVEANPDVPENPPDTDTLISDRDQQAAQESPDRLSEDPLPEVAGTEDSQKIVEGSLDSLPVPFVPPGEEGMSPEQGEGDATGLFAGDASSPEAEEMQALRPQLPPPPVRSLPPEFLEGDPDDTDPDGVALTRSERGEAEQEAEDPETTEGRVIHLFPHAAIPTEAFPAEASTESESAQGGRLSGAQPLPRPTLSPRVIEGPLMRSERSAPRIGQIAVDSTFSEFGEYLQRMMEVIQRQWHLHARGSTMSPEDSPSRVRVRFVLTRNGEVHSTEVIHTTAGSRATLITLDAIESRAPFGAWTAEMVAVYGDETEFNIQFIYW